MTFHGCVPSRQHKMHSYWLPDCIMVKLYYTVDHITFAKWTLEVIIIFYSIDFWQPLPLIV